MSEQNLKTVQEIYGAFGRGDVPAILERVTDDTEWGFNVGSSDVPWHGTFRGKQDLPRFFGAFVENVDLEAFEPRAFMDFESHVVVHLKLAYTVKKTGKKVSEEQLQWWTLEGGKVSRLMHYEDTAQVVQAWRG
ncbi:MAG TPA: nuclear transport factor 2 family protein [Chloroflexota bacterium]